MMIEIKKYIFSSFFHYNVPISTSCEYIINILKLNKLAKIYKSAQFSEGIKVFHLSAVRVKTKMVVLNFEQTVEIMRLNKPIE